MKRHLKRNHRDYEICYPSSQENKSGREDLETASISGTIWLALVSACIACRWVPSFGISSTEHWTGTAGYDAVWHLHRRWLEPPDRPVTCCVLGIRDLFRRHSAPPLLGNDCTCRDHFCVQYVYDLLRETLATRSLVRIRNGLRPEYLVPALLRPRRSGGVVGFSTRTIAARSVSDRVLFRLTVYRQFTQSLTLRAAVLDLALSYTITTVPS